MKWFNPYIYNVAFKQKQEIKMTSTGKLSLKFKQPNLFQAQNEALKKRIEELEEKIDELKSRLADETSPTCRGFWENRCGELQLQNMLLEQRNDQILELLTDRQVEELQAIDKAEKDDDEDSNDEMDKIEAAEYDKGCCRKCGEVQSGKVWKNGEWVDHDCYTRTLKADGTYDEVPCDDEDDIIPCNGGCGKKFSLSNDETFQHECECDECEEGECRQCFGCATCDVCFAKGYREGKGWWTSS